MGFVRQFLNRMQKCKPFSSFWIFFCFLGGFGDWFFGFSVVLFKKKHSSIFIAFYVLLQITTTELVTFCGS